MEKKEGLRFNEGKLRYDLLPPKALKEMAKIMTYGATKYAPRNWEKGMDWSKCLASLKRHLADFEHCIDNDDESNCLHIAHVAVNAAFLTEYYSIAPHFDDRQHSYLEGKRIALDIDGVLADFVGAIEPLGVKRNSHWNITYKMQEIFDGIDKYSFYAYMKPVCSSDNWNFEPICYITNRMFSDEALKGTQDFIEKNGFPCVPIYFVGHGKSKVEVLKENRIDIFVDDHFNNFVDITKAGILCYLLDTEQNVKHKVGYKRIKSLDDL